MALWQTDRTNILQFTQIPNFDARILCGRGQIVAILGECDGCNFTGVTWEIGHILTFLNVPDFNDVIFHAATKDQTVRMELGGGQATFGIFNFAENNAGIDIGEAPMLIGRCRQQIIAGWMQ